MTINKPIIHNVTKLQLDNLLKNVRIHAICLVGPPGTGKSYLAEYAAKKCLDKNQLRADSHYLKIDGSNSDGIEQIREIKQFVSLKVLGNKKLDRCIHIDNLESFSIPAQNALLKIIEEPPEGTIIICTTSSTKKVLPTIISRLQLIQVRPISLDQLKREQVNFNIDKDFEKIYLLSEGKIGVFLDLANGGNDSKKILYAMDQAKTILKNNRAERLADIDNLIKSDKFNLEQLIEALCLLLRTLILNKLSSSEDTKNLTAKLEFCVIARKNLEYNISKKLILTQLFYNL